MLDELKMDELLLLDGGVNLDLMLGGAGLVIACVAVAATAPVSIPALAAGALCSASALGGYAIGTGIVSN